MSGDFEWNDPELRSVCHFQPRTACYWNVRGQCVVRQEATDYGDDSFVFVSVEYLPALIRQLSEMLDEADFEPAKHDPEVLRELGLDPETGKTVRGTKAASRARRYRERHKQRDGSVTAERDERDGSVTVANDDASELPFAEAAE